jgi:succinate dehydrogenase / fumarate reductase iron-sulfur subunit
MDAPTEMSGRRRFFARIITTIQAAIGGTLGVLLGGTIISPGLARQQEKWLPAGSLAQLPINEPTPVTIRVARQDGYTQVVELRSVFLVKGPDSAVTALDSTCTHLGCRVSWDSVAGELRCPCHGGAYDRTGEVKSGPPPRALARLNTKIEGDGILVQV